MRISTKGRYGTMAVLDLALHSSQTRLSEIIRATEGAMASVECVDDPEVYPQAPLCAVYDVWSEEKTIDDSNWVCPKGKIGGRTCERK